MLHPHPVTRKRSLRRTLTPDSLSPSSPPGSEPGGNKRSRVLPRAPDESGSVMSLIAALDEENAQNDGRNNVLRVELKDKKSLKLKDLRELAKNFHEKKTDLFGNGDVTDLRFSPFQFLVFHDKKSMTSSKKSRSFASCSEYCASCVFTNDNSKGKRCTSSCNQRAQQNLQRRLELFSQHF